jgi:DNA-binding transcriptional regulator YhcF (GntR family)
MLPFSISLRPGIPIHEQVVYAATRAVVTGQLRPGDEFPSVRALSQALRINPNTAHKVVTALTDAGLLEVRAGIGTVVAQARTTGAGGRRGVLDDDAERLVIEARRAGLSIQEVVAAIRRHWARTVGPGRVR